MQLFDARPARYGAACTGLAQGSASHEGTGVKRLKRIKSTTIVARRLMA
jgi:hypothetical protein